MQQIPKVIIQTSETYKLTDAMTTLIDLNPEYEYKFFDDSQRRDFLLKTFSEKVIDAYDMLVPGAFRADLFRYGYLFTHGGCYFDDKIIAQESLRNIILPDDELLLCDDYTENSVLNSIIMTKPKNFLFLKLLLAACDNVLSQNKSDMLYLTGPKLMYFIFKPFILEKNLRLKHTVIDNDFSSYKNFLILDNTNRDRLLFYKTTQTALNNFCHNPNHYRQLWIRDEIFYKNKQKMYNLTISVYPNPYVDTFNFYADRDELTIERSDCHDFWHYNLRLKILNNQTSQYKCCDLGMNRTLNLDHSPFLLELPNSNIYLSSADKSPSFDIPYNSSNIVITTKPEYRKTDDNEVVILCQSEWATPSEINYDYLVLFTGADAAYHCHEKDTRSKHIYMAEKILSMLKSYNQYNSIKFVFDENQNNLIIPQKNVNHFHSNLLKLFKNTHIDYLAFFSNYSDQNIPTIYNDRIAVYQYIVNDLNDIIKRTGEPLEGNVFYEHHNQAYSINDNFQNKRLNLFYYSRMAVDILEIGFNAGHSALLYLIANPYSKIHFFDLGEHQYSRGCFDYLDKAFPGRISVTWGDSTVTIPQYPPRLFDFIHIDGGHTRFIAESDFHNCRAFANQDTYLMIDDYDGNCLRTFCNQLIKYKQISKMDLLYDTPYHLLSSFLSSN